MRINPIMHSEPYVNYYLSGDIDTRNEIIVLILELYAWNFERGLNISELKQLLASIACIPCAPHSQLKYCTELVDSSAPIARLFEPSDSLFPITMLRNSQPAMRAMRALGLQTDSVPYKLLAYSAKRIEKLYFKNRERAYDQIVLILKCVEKNHRSNSTNDMLKNIPFLPVIPPPKDYILPWYGKQDRLLAPCNLMSGGKLPTLVGSQTAILDTSVLEARAAYKVPSYVLVDIGVRIKPSVSTVIEQLMCLIKIRPQLANLDAIQSMYCDICNFLEISLEKQTQTSLSSKYEHVDLSKLKCLSCVWTGKRFVEPSCVAKEWKCDGPILYPVPEALRFRSLLSKELGCKDSFSAADLFKALSLLCKPNSFEPLSNQCQLLVREIIAELDKFQIEVFEEFPDRKNVMIPDTNFVLRRASDLVFNDVNWCSESSDYKIANSCISPSLAEKVGITFIRRKTLQKYERNYGGKQFGQREDLTRRIANILREYPFDVTFIKEILQNADDAKATKLCVIFDTRQLVSEKTKLISNNWKELQGPALLIWNNGTFTDKDLQGIQNLGFGGKRGDSETIGQFGIGFNVVYHVTDCPSFIARVNGESLLCVFDPLCRYVPGATALHPGWQFNTTDEFWTDFPAIKPGYFINEVNGCPEDLQKQLPKGTLFRLPIRNQIDKKESPDNSIFTEMLPSLLTPASLLKHIQQWITDIKLSLLFLKHLTDIQFYIIDGHYSRESMTLLASYSATLSQQALESRAELESYSSAFNLQQGCTPQVITYPMTITSVIRDLKHDPSAKLPLASGAKCRSQNECWLVQEGVGDIYCQDQNWKFVPEFKPRHGIATSLQPEQSKNGQIFCFLPLPLSSDMPVHINGHFMLAATRRSLWTPTNSDDPDDKTKWNNNLLQAIASSYAHFLLKAIPYYVKKHYLDRENAVSELKKYYKKFPTKYCSGSMKQVADNVFKIFCQQNAKILCSIKHSHDDTGYLTEWAPLMEDKNQENQSYMLFPPSKGVVFANEEAKKEFDKRMALHTKIRCLLEDIGININSVPRFIWNAFNKVECELPIADGRQVFRFCKQFSQKIGRLPCPIEQTSFRSAENFTLLLAYTCIQQERCLDFPDNYIGAPFLLTADGCLCEFAENSKVLLSKYARLFRHIGYLFAHPNLVEMNINSEYFYHPDEESFGFIEAIFMQTIPRSLFQTHVKNSYQDVLSKEFLSKVWECITTDSVFSCHLISILSKWALIPSLQNQLFLYNNQCLLPVDVSLDEFEHQDTSPQDILLMCTIDILQKLQVPFLDTTVCSNDRLISLCPSIFKPDTVLKNLTYLHNMHPIQLENTQLIGILFEYFSEVAFGSKNDKSSRDCICSLPFFENIDGKFTSLKRKTVFLWPHNVEQAGLSSWLTDDVVFLTKKGEWTKLGAAQDVFSIKDITAVQLYMQYIFPRFKLLSESDRYKHLKHVRDNLFRQFHDNNPFEKFDCVENEQGEFGYLFNYCDPDVKLFHTFSSRFTFPNRKYHKTKWLEFFRKFGLRQEVSMCEFEELSRLVENGNHPELPQASEDLLEYLLYTLCRVNWRLDNIPGAEDWTRHKYFLKQVFNINFVVVENLARLNWIVPQCSERTTRIVQNGTTYYLTKLDGAAISNNADTIWTVLPIIKLPHKYSYTNIVMYYTGMSSFLSDMGLVMGPSVSDIVKNIENIATLSEFTNLSLFDKYTLEVCENESLLRVLSSNFDKLSKVQAELRIPKCRSLASMKCIPVFAGNFTQQNWFILVEPQCVVVSSAVQEFQPYLNPLPKDLMAFMSNVLEHIGVKHELEFEHCHYALEKMHQCSGDQKQVDFNTQVVLEKLLKRMYAIMQNQSSIANITTLYLPSIHLRLMPSSSLLYCDDDSRYQHCEYTVCEDSTISVLWFPDSANSEYFCKLLPKKVRPKPLSSCEESLLSKPVETKTNPVTEELQTALQIEKSISILEKILHHQCKEENNSRLLIEYFRKVLYGARVVAIPNLTVALSFKTSSEGEVEIAKCAVDYFIDESVTMHDRSTIYIDDSISDVSTAFFSVQMPMAKHILMISSLESHEKLQYSLSLLLKPQNEKSFKSILGLCNIRDIHPHLLFPNILVPKIGLEVPDNWHQKLVQNMRNIFRTNEWVAFETRSEPRVYIFTQIVCPDVNEKGRMPDDIYSHQYFIHYPDEDEPRSVSIQLLYKFQRSSPSRSLVLRDENSDESTIQSDHKDEIMQILDGLRGYRPEEQRRIIRRLFLQWHPDKNLDNVTLAHDVFTFLNHELERRHLVNAPSVDEWNREASNHRQASEQAPPSNEYFEQAEPDIDQAWRWLGQARLDKQALDIILLTGNDKLSGHVCFLAHEVTEKALKAGMYAIYGDVSDHLKNHLLYPLSKSIICKLSDQSSTQITHTVSVLENYYNETRWPNRWPGLKLPAEHFTPVDARQAQVMAANVIETIETLIQENS